MPNHLERRAIERLVKQAEVLGVGDQVPDTIRAMLSDHGPGSGGAMLWDRQHPDDDVFRGCCDGEMVKGAAFCTCWTPVHDLPQAEVIPPGDGEITVREDGMCGDCAYRPGSPELKDQFMAETLRELPLEGQTFWCHDGMRKIIRWEHPDGRTVTPHGDDYDPPIINGVPFRATGRVGALCAGWAACSRRWDNQLYKEERATDRA